MTAGEKVAHRRVKAERYLRLHGHFVAWTRNALGAFVFE